MNPRLPAAAMIASMCLAHVVGMLTFSIFPALLPTFLAEWQLGGSEAGWLSGVFFIGYMVSVPLLAGLTDRYDARWIYFVSALVSFASTLAFAFWAEGFLSALPLRFLAGVGMAGTYMPGLKALNDRLPAPARPRAVSFYTASFGVGASASFYLAGEIADRLDWHWAFGLCSSGALIGLLLAIVILRPIKAPTAKPETLRVLDPRPVLRNRPAMGYILAYAVHNWELFGTRSWVVTFLTFAAALRPGEAVGWLTGTVVAAIMNLTGMPASILGNELAIRFGRRRVLAVIMCISGLISCGIGFAAGLPYGLIVGLFILHAVFLAGDSSAITTGAIMAADPARSGGTMAMHSFIGFGFAFLGAFIPGLTLDLFGGPASETAWIMAFISIGAVIFLGPLLIYLLDRRPA